MKQQHRNLIVDFIKFNLAIIVALGHYGISGKIDGGFAVTVFFLISGYYLMKGIYNKKKEPSISFIKRKVKKLYLPYITVFSLLLLYNIVNKVFVDKVSCIEIIKYLLNSLQEVLLLQGFGFSQDPVNPTMWFFSVLLISTCIIHKVICLNKEIALRYIFPVIIICIIPIFMGNFDPWGKLFGIVYIPLLKGFATLLMGIYTYLIEDWYNTTFSSVFRFGVSLLSFVACLYIGSESCIYIVFAILMLLPLYSLNFNISDNKLKNGLEKLFSLSDQIYFSHFMVITVLNVLITMLDLPKVNPCVYIIFVVFVAGAMSTWCKLVQNTIKKNNGGRL